MFRDVTVRLAGRADSEALRRLAELDSATAPVGPMVVAEIDGQIVATVPLAAGPPIADPFQRTAALVEMLELRAAQLGSQAPATRRRSTRARVARLMHGARPAPSPTR